METVKYQEEIEKMYTANKDICQDDNYLTFIIAFKKGMKHAEAILTKR